MRSRGWCSIRETGWIPRWSTFSIALFSARPMIPPYAAVALTPAQRVRRCASPQALAPLQARPVPLGRDLEESRNIAESRVIHQTAEGEWTHLSLAHLLVAVHAAAERLHRIVQMERL